MWQAVTLFAFPVSSFFFSFSYSRLISAQGLSKWMETLQIGDYTTIFSFDAESNTFRPIYCPIPLDQSCGILKNYNKKVTI